MDYCILVHLSRYTISFSYYTKDNGKFEPYGEGLDRPLAIWFSGTKVIIGSDAKREALRGTHNAYYDLFKEMSRQDSFEYSNEKHRFNKLILYTIRAGLKEFFVNVMKNYYGDFEEKIATLPLLLVINPDIDNNDRNILIRQLKDNGFGNIEEIDENKVIIDTFHNSGSHNSILILSSNGTDLHGVLVNQGHSSSFTMKDAGKDPRANKLMDLIWQRTQAENDWLEMENELSELRNAALRYIQSGETEYNGNIVFSNGYDYPYFLSKHDLNLYTQQDGSKIVREIIEKVSAISSKRDSLVILKNQAANNKYLQDLLMPEFPGLKIIDKDGQELLWNRILDYAKTKKFRFAQIVPTQSVKSKPSINLTTVVKESKPNSPQSISSPILQSEPSREEKKHARVLEKTFDNNPDKAAACAEIRAFLNAMHKKGITCFDDKLMPLLTNAPKDSSPSSLQPPKESQQSPTVPKDKQRDYSQTTRLIRKQLERKEYDTAKKELESLRKRMGSYFKVEICQLTDQIPDMNSSNIRISTSSKTPTKPAIPRSAASLTASTADVLAKQGDFKAAREAYRTDGNAKKADSCTDIIKFEKRFLSLYEKDAKEQNISKQLAKQRITEVQEMAVMYKSLGASTKRIDQLIKDLKQIR